MPVETAPHSVTRSLGSPEETAAFARRLAGRLGAGDVLLLDGPIGAGKTHFARAVIQARQAEFGQSEEVPSPTFTLVQTYDAGPLEIWHVDLYRLGGPQDAIELGLDQAFDTALCLVEWPERLGPIAPRSALRIAFRLGASDSGREVTLSASDARWAPLLRELADA